MATQTQLNRAVRDRSLVRITEENGYHKGLVGIAMGIRPAYGNVKVGFVDSDGRYTGDYTVVSWKHVELMKPPRVHSARPNVVSAFLRVNGFSRSIRTASRVKGLPVVSSGFDVHVQDGATVVLYTLGEAGRTMSRARRREAVSGEVRRMERVLSQRFSVTLFEPDEGEVFRLTVREQRV